MPIIYPRPLPDGIPYRPTRFRLNEGTVANPTRGPLINVSRTIEPYWEIDILTDPLRQSQLAELQAWWNSLKGGLKSALIEQPAQCVPKAYFGNVNRAPAEDLGNLSQIKRVDWLRINSINAGIVNSVGDLIGLEYNGYYGLHRITSIEPPDPASGGVREFLIEPNIRSYVAHANGSGVGGAVVRWISPKLIMRPIPGSFRFNDSDQLTTVSMSFRESPQ